MGKWVEWFRGEEGQGLVEYGLIIALVAMVIMAALTLLGTNLNATFNMISTTVGGV